VKTTVWRNAICDSVELDSTAKHVAHVLSRYMNTAGFTFVGKPTVARAASLSVRAVDGGINRLEKAGYLLVDRRKGRRPNHYSAAVPNPAADAGLTPQEVRGSTPHLTQPAPHLTTANPAGAAPEEGFKRGLGDTPQPPAARGARKIPGKELRRYTGWRFVRGSHGSTFVEDPLGTDRPPPSYPDRKPTEEQVMAALGRVSA
jgi:hypothetical protein